MDLRKLRKSKGLTQIEAADIVGLSRRGYQNLEAGTYKKKDSNTLQYALAKLESMPNPRKRQNTLSITNIARRMEDLLEGESVSFAYFAKDGGMLRFALATDMDRLELYSLEEELSSMLETPVEFLRFEDLIKDEKALFEFLSTARRIYPS